MYYSGVAKIVNRINGEAGGSVNYNEINLDILI